MIRELVTFMICVTTGCANVPNIDMGDTQYQVHYYSDFDSFNRARIDYGRKPTDSARGTYAWRNDVCHILIRQVSTGHDACTVGHEKRHCIEGNWHPGRKTASCW